ncbi:MAG: ABC transporter permease [bacterium]
MMNSKSEKQSRHAQRQTLKTSLPLVLRIAVILGLVLLWELAALTKLINSTVIPAPHQIAIAYVELFKNGTLLGDLLQSIHRVMVGFCAALFFGIPLGLLSGISRRVRTILLPIIDVIRPIPPIAWVPLAIIWFGLGDHPSYFIVLLGAFPPVFLNSFAGVESIDRQYIDVARCLGATRWRIMYEVILPGALPAILVGVRIGSAIAWTSVIAAELVGAQDGLGYMIQLNRLMLQTDNLLVGMITIGIAGVVLNIVLAYLSSILLPWKPASSLSLKSP